MVSGANLDDLGEYRPGLDAAREHGVRHPYIEAAFDKAAVRALARELGLGARGGASGRSLPFQPGRDRIRIEPAILAFIHEVEGWVGAALAAAPSRAGPVRCRVRAAGLVVELDPLSLTAPRRECDREDLAARIRRDAPAGLPAAPVRFLAYRTGSAFLTGVSA